MERQAILGKPLNFYVVLDEMVFHRMAGSPDLMVEQCEQLIALIEAKKVTIQVLPLDLGVHAGLQGGFAIAEIRDEPDMVYRDMLGEGQVIDSPDFVAMATEVWDSLRTDSYPQRASIEVIRSWASKWKNAK